MMRQVTEKEFNVGYDAASDRFVDMFEAGIVDPAKVTRAAIQNGVLTHLFSTNSIK